ncbi:hypothetical protein, partial [Alkalibacterium sp. s-m-22]
ASDFLQIPPHGGHPCHSLTVPTAKPVVDFHHQVVAHAGRTKKRPVLFTQGGSFYYNLSQAASH